MIAAAFGGLVAISWEPDLTSLPYRAIRCDLESRWFQSITPVERSFGLGFDLAALSTWSLSEDGGLVCVFSSEDGSVLAKRDEWPAAVESVRGEIERVADVSGDGSSDLAVLARGYEPGVSGLLLLSGGDLWVLAEHFVQDRTIANVCTTADLDGDGLEDIALAVTTPGAVEVRSAANLELIREIPVPWISEDIIRCVTLESFTRGSQTQLMLGNPDQGGVSVHDGGLYAIALVDDQPEVKRVFPEERNRSSATRRCGSARRVLCSEEGEERLASLFTSDDHSSFIIEALDEQTFAPARSLTRPNRHAHGWPFGIGLSFCEDLSGDGVREVVVGFPEYNGVHDNGALYFYSGADHDLMGIVAGAEDVWKLGTDVCSLGSGAGTVKLGALTGRYAMVIEVPRIE